jgi:hypothetical protein
MSNIAVAAGAAGGGVVFASVAVCLVLLRRSGGKVREQFSVFLFCARTDLGCNFEFHLQECSLVVSYFL